MKGDSPALLQGPVLGIWLTLVAVAAWASSGLIGGWRDDPALRFAPWIFGLWLAAVGVHGARGFRHSGRLGTLLAGVGGALLVLGILGELRALVYLALALLLLVPVGRLRATVLLGLACLCWMPIWYWGARTLIGHDLAVPTFATALAVSLVSLLPAFRRHEIKTTSDPV